MRTVLAILCVLTFMGGCSILAGAKSAIHEIEGFVLFLISAVLLVGGAVIEALGRSHKKFETMAESVSASARHTAEVADLLRQERATETAHEPSAPPPLGTRKAVSAEMYHYAGERGVMGPFTSEDIREFRVAGVIRDDTLLFKKGDTEWKPLSRFAEFTETSR